MLPNDFYSHTQKTIHHAVRETKAFEKFLNYGKKLMKDEDFVKELVWFRAYWANVETDEPLPLQGLLLPKTNTDRLNQSYDRISNEDEDDYLNAEEYEFREQEFRSKYGLDIYGEAFDFLLLYGSVEPMKDMGYCSFLNVFNLIDETNLELEDEVFGKNTVVGFYKIMEHFARQTPIAILIHPFMTQNDIIDAVKKIYKVAIEPEQKRFRRKEISVDKTRRSSPKIKQRNNFILENQNLPIKKLTSLVNKEFPRTNTRGEAQYYDYTYIQSILKKETNRKKINGST